MMSTLVSLLLGMCAPVIMVGVNSNMEKSEKRSCYSILVICGLIFLLVWGRDTNGINWYLVVFIAILVLLNIKSPTVLKGALETLLGVIPNYLEELRNMELSSGSDEVNLTLSYLIESIFRFDICIVILSLTPLLGKRQGFCVIFGTLLYLFLVHYFLLKNEQLNSALQNIRNSVRVKLNLANVDYGETEDVEDEADVEEEEEEREIRHVTERSQSAVSKLQQDMIVDNILEEDLLPTEPKQKKESLTDLLGLDDEEEDEDLNLSEDILLSLDPPTENKSIRPISNLRPTMTSVQPVKVVPVRPGKNINNSQ